MTGPRAEDDFAPAGGIDPDRLRGTFAESGIVQIRPFLAGDGAGRLRHHLAGRENWTRAVKTAVGTFEHDHAASGMSPAQLKALAMLAAPAARSDFTYAYDRIVAVDREARRRDGGTLLARFADFLERPDMLDLLASICGDETIASVETHATRYGPGHFLAMHSDWEDGSRRRVAYVLGLAETWRPEWGGLLLFHDRDGEVVRGFVPRMNALTLFKVPRAHSVSLVGDHAGAPRYSVSGWLNGPLEGETAQPG
jgi:hypothetical protein